MKQSSSATVGITLSDELWGRDDQNKALFAQERKKIPTEISRPDLSPVSQS